MQALQRESACLGKVVRFRDDENNRVGADGVAKPRKERPLRKTPSQLLSERGARASVYASPIVRCIRVRMEQHCAVERASGFLAWKSRASTTITMRAFSSLRAAKCARSCSAVTRPGLRPVVPWPGAGWGWNGAGGEVAVVWAGEGGDSGRMTTGKRTDDSVHHRSVSERCAARAAEQAELLVAGFQVVFLLLHIPGGLWRKGERISRETMHSGQDSAINSGAQGRGQGISCGVHSRVFARVSEPGVETCRPTPQP